MAVTVQGITQGSPAEKMGFAMGMKIVSIDGHEINDGLDYEFYSSGARLVVLVQYPGEEEAKEIVVCKEEYQPLGCEFASYLIDKQHRCNNDCVFCFVDQLPKGMREPLYFKDDDERLSFLFGNYITLTNLKPKEVDRIIEMKISPVNISVHTANPQLRAKMMGNRFAGQVLEYIPKLAKGGIQLNMQLVLCPGLNDGEELRRRIESLAAFFPQMQSIAAVPVGLSKHRENLAKLRPYTKEEAAEQLAILLEYGDRFKEEFGTRMVYPSDEWFLLAGQEIPPEEFYDGYLQLENGVGMWRLLEQEFTEALEQQQSFAGEASADLVVGMLAAPLLQKLAVLLEEKFPTARLTVHPIVNDFFGHGITVTGLLTGQDIIAQLQGKLKSERLLLPSVLLRAQGDVLLDDMTPEEIGKALDVAVEIVPEGGENLLEAALDRE